MSPCVHSTEAGESEQNERRARFAWSSWNRHPEPTSFVIRKQTRRAEATCVLCSWGSLTAWRVKVLAGQREKRRGTQAVQAAPQRETGPLGFCESVANWPFS